MGRGRNGRDHHVIRRTLTPGCQKWRSISTQVWIESYLRGIASDCRGMNSSHLGFKRGLECLFPQATTLNAASAQCSSPQNSEAGHFHSIVPIPLNGSQRIQRGRVQSCKSQAMKTKELKMSWQKICNTMKSQDMNTRESNHSVLFSITFETWNRCAEIVQ